MCKIDLVQNDPKLKPTFDKMKKDKLLKCDHLIKSSRLSVARALNLRICASVQVSEQVLRDELPVRTEPLDQMGRSPCNNGEGDERKN